MVVEACRGQDERSWLSSVSSLVADLWLEEANMAVPLADHQSLGYSLGKALLGARVLSPGAGDKGSGDISWLQQYWLGGSACSPWGIEMLPAYKLVMIKRP